MKHLLTFKDSINESGFYTAKDGWSLWPGDLFKFVKEDLEKIPEEFRNQLKADTEYSLVGSGGEWKDHGPGYYIIEDKEAKEPIIIKFGDLLDFATGLTMDGM
jgi:hypothetical protein